MAQTKEQSITSAEALKYFDAARQARRDGQVTGMSWRELAELADAENAAWLRYVRMLRIEHNRKNVRNGTYLKFITPARPI